MAAKSSLDSLLVLTLMISLPLAASSVVSSEPRGFRATLFRTESTINLTQAAHNSHKRMSMLAAASSGRVSAQAPLRVDGYEYNLELSIGTPPQRLSAMADTGSDLIWVKCGACDGCTPQGSPYHPEASSSFSTLPCSDHLCRALGDVANCGGTGGEECEYTYLYGVEYDPHVYTNGYLVSETFTLGGEAVPGVAFGCTAMSEGIYGTSSGIVGLGRGPLSLVSQFNVGAFSYCLSERSMASPLLFGSLAAMKGAGVQSMQLLETQTYYSVSVERISIGAVTTLGPGSMLLDSGTALTFLTEPFYTMAKAAVLNQTASLHRVAALETSGFEVCFQAVGVWSAAAFPAMVLHFGGGAVMAVPPSSCFREFGNGVVCWVVQRSSRLSIIGNIMQRNYHIRFDVGEGVVSFLKADCDRL